MIWLFLRKLLLLRPLRHSPNKYILCLLYSSTTRGTQILVCTTIFVCGDRHYVTSTHFKWFDRDFISGSPAGGDLQILFFSNCHKSNKIIAWWPYVPVIEHFISYNIVARHFWCDFLWWLVQFGRSLFFFFIINNADALYMKYILVWELYRKVRKYLYLLKLVCFDKRMF